MSLIKLIRKATCKYFWLIFVGFLLVAIASALSLASPLMTQRVIDIVIPAKNLSSLLIYAVLYFLLFLGAQIAGILQAYVFTKVGSKIVIEIRSHTVYSALKNYSGSARKIEVGNALTRLTGDLPEAASFLTSILVEILTQAATLAIAVGILFSMDSKLAFIVLGGIPFILLSTEIFLKEHKKRIEIYRKKSSALADRLSETWIYRSQLFFYRAYRYALQKINNNEEDVYKENMAMFKFQSFAGAIQALAAFLPPFIVLFAGAWWIMNDQMTIGSIVAAMSYMGRIYGPVRGLVNFRTRYQSFKVAISRITELCGIEIDVAEYNDLAKHEAASSFIARNCDEENLSIEFDRVSFCYDDAERSNQVLTNVSFMFSGPGVIKLAGANGTGKSTFLALLFGALKPDSGRVLINGKDVSSFSDTEIRNILSIVPQQDAVFHDSYMDNVLLDSARQEAEAESMMYTLGFDQELRNEKKNRAILDSSTLSGGQAKKICLLRGTILQNPILVLDEPFSSLDKNSRNNFSSWLKLQAEKRVILLVDHGHDDLLTGISGNKLEIKLGCE